MNSLLCCKRKELYSLVSPSSFLSPIMFPSPPTSSLFLCAQAYIWLQLPQESSIVLINVTDSSNNNYSSTTKRQGFEHVLPLHKSKHSAMQFIYTAVLGSWLSLHQSDCL